MTKFATKIITLIKAREVVEELYINDESVLAMFRVSLKGTTYETELNTILRYVQEVADGRSAGARLKILSNPTYGIKEYEFRSDHLRLYAIQLPNKKIIIYGGKKRKADSSDNIKAFRAVKKDFIVELNTFQNDKRRTNPK